MRIITSLSLRVRVLCISSVYLVCGRGGRTLCLNSLRILRTDAPPQRHTNSFKMWCKMFSNNASLMLSAWLICRLFGSNFERRLLLYIGTAASLGIFRTTEASQIRRPSWGIRRVRPWFALVSGNYWFLPLSSSPLSSSSSSSLQFYRRREYLDAMIRAGRVAGGGHGNATAWRPAL